MNDIQATLISVSKKFTVTGWEHFGDALESAECDGVEAFFTQCEALHAN